MKHWASPLVPALILAATMFASVEAQSPRHAPAGYNPTAGRVQQTARWQPVPDPAHTMPPGLEYEVPSGVPDYYEYEEPLWEDDPARDQAAPAGMPRVSHSDPARAVLKPEIAERFDYGGDHDPDGLWLDDPTWYGGEVWADGGCCDDLLTCRSYRFPGAEWFFQGEFTLLHRNRPEEVDLTSGFLRQVGNSVTEVNQVLLSTDSVDFDVEPGMRLTLGRNLGLDEEGRMHSIEGSFMGLQDWSEQAVVYGQNVNLNTQVGTIEVGNLMSNFDGVGGFNFADVQTFSYSSNLQSAEVNYRIRRNPGRELLQAEQDGSWVRRLGRVVDASVHFGLRYLHIDEDFQYGSSGNRGAGNVTLPSSGLWQTSTRNDMFGGQFGGELMVKRERFWAGVRGNFGVLVNFSDLDGRIDVTDYVFPLDRSSSLVDPHNAFSMNSTTLGVVGDVGLSLVYDVSRQAKLKAGYNFMWVEGIALAPDQFQNHSVRGPDAMNNDGYTFFHGPSAGFEWAW